MFDRPFSQPSVMASQQHFSGVPKADIERSRFDRSHGHKTTFDAGKLIPVFVDEVLPGDTFNLGEVHFARMATPLKPIMDNIYYETFYFFVPNRLVWDNWERFCGERATPNDNSVFSIPRVSIAMDAQLDDDLSAYMGLPQRPDAIGSVIQVSALPFRAFWLIFNEWFRDQNLIVPTGFSTGDTAVEGRFLTGPCPPRGKRHDYFTSCLPWPQKGDPVFIPVDGIPVVAAEDGLQPPTFYAQGTSTGGGPLQIEPGTGNVKFGGTVPGAQSNAIWNLPRLELGLAEEGATINDLRAAFQIQRLLERDARGGTRYIEVVLAHFLVQSDDARVQRPEYLGGSSGRISINPVAATFANSEVAQGDLGATGVGLCKGGWSKSFTEHGHIIGIASVRADLTYQQGVDRMWDRRTRYDFYWPVLAHLGEQAVKNREIFLTLDGGGTDDAVFGYQERYAEYRFKLSRITGKFQSGNPESLDVWHLAQDFASVPVLNPSFINENPPIDRVVAVPSEPQFLVDIWFDLKCDRPIPVYSVPGMADHF